MNIKRGSAVLFLAVSVGFGAVSSASAIKVDLATKGSNSSGWSSMGECKANRPNDVCVSIVDGCGGYDLYTTDRIDDALGWALNKGDSIHINILENNRFAGFLCRLDPN